VLPFGVIKNTAAAADDDDNNNIATTTTTIINRPLVDRPDITC